jgi:hypothetical protein
MAQKLDVPCLFSINMEQGSTPSPFTFPLPSHNLRFALVVRNLPSMVVRGVSLNGVYGQFSQSPGAQVNIRYMLDEAQRR